VILDQDDLESWGNDIGANTETPLVLGLRGEMGAGKSVFARAVARGAGVIGHLPSPTYNLLYKYPSTRGVDVYHIDLYRLDNPDDVWELGWRELAEGNQIVLIEWPERAEHLLPPDRWDITLAVDPKSPVLRDITVARSGMPPALPADSRRPPSEISP
jgi:tRNA threonylcarbamoyladenosine biosynthesis protein TsaE